MLTRIFTCDRWNDSVLLEQAIGSLLSLCVYVYTVLPERASTAISFGPPLSRSEAAKGPGGLSLVGRGVMDGGGVEGRARVPPTSRFTIIKKKRRKRKTRKEPKREVEKKTFFFFFFFWMLLYSTEYAATLRHGGAVTDSPHSFPASALSACSNTSRVVIIPLFFSSFLSFIPSIHFFSPYFLSLFLHILHFYYFWLSFSPPFDFFFSASNHQLMTLPTSTMKKRENKRSLSSEFNSKFLRFIVKSCVLCCAVV